MERVTRLNWLAATEQSPLANPEVRLAEAGERRRGQVARYIFLGPETARQQAYKTASWTAQSLQALQNLGIFYVFEVAARGAARVASEAVRNGLVEIGAGEGPVNVLA